ncbi:MAG: metal ABC transporter ATP-binding protein [Lachnospiraceae bacterium]
MAQLICKDVSLGYEGKSIAQDINFEVNKGDYLCIVGENGSGKSTLVKALLHQIQPLSGKIETAEGFSLKDIGYLPQQTEVQRDFPASVMEVVQSGCIRRCKGPFYGAREKQIAKQNMQKLDILSLSKKCYRELSGGQQQRVLLCRALCAAKKLLLLDEPVTGLDPVVTSEMYSLIANLNQEGITVIMVSHDIAAALKYASHILHIAQEQLFFGKKQDYLKSEAGKLFMPNGGTQNA